MKPATDQSNGEVVETTTRRRIIPVPSPSSANDVDFFEYLRTFDASKWDRHIIYLSRVEPKPNVSCGKGKGFIELPNGERTLLTDREELELALTRLSGGTYRLILKDGPSIARTEHLDIGAPVRQIPQVVGGATSTAGNGTGTTSLFGANDPTALVAGKAIDAIAGREHDAVNIGLGMMNTAAGVVRQFAEGRPGSTPQDALMHEVLAELRTQHRSGMSLQEILAAASSIIAILKELGIFGGNANPMVGQVMEVAMKRLLEPPAPSGSPVNTSTALVQALPTIGSQFVEGLRSYAAARQSEERIVAMQRASMPANALPSPQVIPAAPPTNGAANPPNPGQAMEAVQRKIIEIFHLPISATDAADKTMEFLESIDANANAQLAALGEDGLLQMFATQPLLKVATANLPRLTEFIRAFLRMHAEDVAAENGQAQPAATKQPLAN